MVDPTPIVTTDRLKYRHPKATVYVAPSLRDHLFVEVHYLRAERLRIVCGPEFDECQLTYRYGNALREDAVGPGATAFPPLELNGKYVKVVITDTVYEDAFAADPETDEEDLSITWFGVIDYDDRDTDGTAVTTPQGTQQFTALGLLWLLFKTYVETSIVDIDGTAENQFTALSGLTFNEDPGGVFVQRGNQSPNKVPSDGDTHLFSWETRGQSKWSAYTAVMYLLKHHSPTKVDGTPANTWRLDADEESLSWYEITEQTDRRSLKDLLDSLIPRFRGVGYYVDFDITRTDPEDAETAANEVVVHAFTFAKDDVITPTGTLKANPNQRSLDFEFAIDIEKCTVGNTTMVQYHEIVGEGALRTTTFTTRISDRDTWSEGVILGPSWTDADEAEYKAGASTADDYSGLTSEQKKNRNAVARTADRLREVFRRFVMNTQRDTGSRWDGKILEPHKRLGSGIWWLRGDQTADPFSAAVEEGSDYVGTDYVPAVKILRTLPLYERADYSGDALATFDYQTEFAGETNPSFMPLLAYARTSQGDGDVEEIEEGETPHRYEMLDRLHQKQFDPSSNRNWSCRIHLIDTDPGIELIADTAHFIGGPTAGGAGYALTDDSQLSSQHGGLNYSDMWVTMTVELTERLQVKRTLESPDANAPKRTLIISVPSCRCDYVIPKTTVGIEDGLPVPTNGGFARNDRDRLEAIVMSAEQWYSTIRQTLNLRWKQIRSTFQLGDLITDVGGRYQLTNINTPITAIVYHLGPEHQPGQTAAGGTSIETDFVSLDFQ